VAIKSNVQVVPITAEQFERHRKRGDTVSIRTVNGGRSFSMRVRSIEADATGAVVVGQVSGTGARVQVEISATGRTMIVDRWPQ